MSGVVCANFGYERGVKPGKCNGAWHAHCYRKDPRDSFPVCQPQGDDEQLVAEERMETDDTNRFQEARDGDFLVTQFQCDQCHFENCQHRSAVSTSVQDELALVCIRRANLDAFWSRERSTVGANRREGLRYLGAADSCGWSTPYPARGPFPVRDDSGMQMATSMLLRSMDAGNNAKTVQYETVRKMRSHLSSFFHTVPGGIGASFMTEEGGGATISMSPTNSMWFKRFMKGSHKRMGDVWIPDRPVTIHELKAAFELLEADWDELQADIVGRRDVVLTATMLISGFFGALRGEEIVRVDVGEMRSNWKEALSYPELAHVPLMLAGRFKREIGEKLFCQPLAAVSKSGIKIALWFHRALEILAALGVQRGPLFRKRGRSIQTVKRATVGDLDPMLHKILKRVQSKWPSIIPDAVDVEDEYSSFRSLRRGATSEAQNCQIPKEVIEANNRWRKQSRSRGLTPGMSMMERYSDAKASVPTLTRFSAEL